MGIENKLMIDRDALSKKHSVLILDGQVEHSISFVQELGKIDTVVHVAATKECLTFKSTYVSKAIMFSAAYDDKEFMAWVRSLDDKYHYDLIVPVTENMLVVFQQLDEGDVLRKKAFLASPDSIAIALDKTTTTLLAKSLSIPVPHSVLLNKLANVAHSDNYPLVLKTSQSFIERDGKTVYSPVCIASNAEERGQFLEKWLPYCPVQQQEYFQGEGWGVEFLYVSGHCVLHFCHQRIHELPLTGGGSSYRRSANAPKAMLDAGKAILDQLNWHGLAMVEFKMNENGEFVLLEINPRSWGSLPLSVKAGVNFPVEMLNVAVGAGLPQQPTYTVDYYARNFSKDIEWLGANILADHRNKLLLTKNRWFSILEWARPLVGKESWDHFDWTDLAVFRSQLVTFTSRLFSALFGRLGDFFDTVHMWLNHQKNKKQLAASGEVITDVLFVCYGNICRSPVAEYAAKQLSADITYSSTGFHDEVLRKTPENIASIATNLELDLSGHRSCRISQEQVLATDIIVVMDQKNFEDVRQHFPEATNKILMLGLFSKPKALTILDPYALNDAAAADALSDVVNGVKGLVSWCSALK